MLDLKFIRQNPEKVKESIQNRGVELDLEGLLQLDNQQKELTQTIDSWRNQRNKISKEIGEGKTRGKNCKELTPLDSKQLTGLMVQMEKINASIKELTPRLKETRDKLNALLLVVPNIIYEGVPVGKGEGENKEINRWGEPRKFDFTPRQHWELGELLGIIDFSRADRKSVV